MSLTGRWRLSVEEHLSEKDESFGIDGDSDPSLTELCINDILQMARTLKPSLDCCPGRVWKVILLNVFSRKKAGEIGLAEPIFEPVAERVGMREVAGCCHVRAVATCDVLQRAVEPERRQTTLASNSVDLRQNKLFLGDSRLSPGSSQRCFA